MDRGLLRAAGDDAAPPISTVLLVGCYSSFASMYMLVSFVAPFFPPIGKGWGLTSSQIGLICACDAIGEVLSSAFATLALAKLGAVRASTLGMVGNGISSLLFGMAPLLTHNPRILFPFFVSMRLINGAATNITYIGLMTVLCTLMPNRTGQVVSTIAVLTTAGLTAGPPFRGLLITSGGWLVDTFKLNHDWQFATPFVGCTLLLLAPTWVLYRAREEVAGADSDGVSEEGEEEEDISCSEELRRMGAVLNRTTLTAVSKNGRPLN
jgi:MFS family permease